MKAIFTFLFSVLIIPALLAQIPRTISYQGVLIDNSGNPKPDGDYSFTFSFYESSTGVNAIWSETKVLNVSKGLLSTSLGDQTAFDSDIKFDKPYWLGIKVGEEEELSPRITLTSSGYSLSSNNTLDLVDGNEFEIRGGPGIQTIQNTNNTLNIANPNGPTTTINVKVPLTLNQQG